ncbi:cobalt-precorrin-6A reductase [Gordonia sp. X0973]|uniref:cobalt-precorrin-6A reductase n=1 Tax=Gordonia sp. X0973 TaxID=2742602 RepID=UPI000F534460|nr:cobalt-precorrin-6A reductase [Gordonia sp. X0973]QKT07361.1 cobalt-precorrin-6A reductase [Gordonia sp. X0973]
MAVLILGGTGEAREVAQRLVADRVPVISSLAGRVANPRLPVGEVRSGGFGGVDGLVTWLREHRPSAVVDATHPFAQQISRHATTACGEAEIPLLRLLRPAWTPVDGDRWVVVPDIAAAARAVAESDARRVMLTTGRQDVGAFAAIDGKEFLIRVVDPPSGPLPPHREILRSRGPYGLDEERALLVDHDIDLLVTKNSGGGLVEAKLVAARELGLPVIVVDRPAESCETVVSTVDEAVAWIKRGVDQSP